MRAPARHLAAELPFKIFLDSGDQGAACTELFADVDYFQGRDCIYFFPRIFIE